MAALILIRQSALFLASLVIILALGTTAQAQSLRHGNVRSAAVTPMRSPAHNAHMMSTHAHMMSSAHAHMMSAHMDHVRNMGHRGAERNRDLFRGFGFGDFFPGSYGGFFPGYTGPYYGGYVNPGYTAPSSGGYTGAAPGDSGASQPSYPSYGNTQTPLYYGGGGYYVPSYTSSSVAPVSDTSKLGQGLDTGKILTAVGIPNGRDQLSYPLGLQVLQPQTENMQLLDQIEALLQLMASQQSSGKVNPNLATEATGAIDRLQTMLRARQSNMMANVYLEAQQYLDKLRHGLKVLQHKAVP
jgi:hypothetical protein